MSTTVSTTFTWTSGSVVSAELTSLIRLDTGAAVSGVLSEVGSNPNVQQLVITEPEVGLYYAFTLAVTHNDGSVGTLKSYLKGSASQPPPASSQSSVYAYFYDGAGNPLADKTFQLKMLTANVGTDIWNGEAFASTASGSDGKATATAVSGAAYSISVDGHCWSEWFTIDSDSVHVTEIVAKLPNQS